MYSNLLSYYYSIIRCSVLQLPRWDGGSVPHYSFNWKTRYEFKEPVAAPKGTRVECLAHFDNSAKNLNNPNPANLVYWGDQTWQEMMIGFVDYALAEGIGGKE